MKMRLTLEQHREFAESLKQMRETLMQPHIICVGTKASQENRAVRAMLNKLDHLKNVMDSVVCSDFPNVEDAPEIYYGFSKALREPGENQP